MTRNGEIHITVLVRFTALLFLQVNFAFCFFAFCVYFTCISPVYCTGSGDNNISHKFDNEKYFIFIHSVQSE